MTPGGLRIGIFGGAFDPVHLGHKKIADSFLGSNIIDKLLILPTPVSPHKESDSQTDFSHRYKMLKLAFRGNDRIDVSDLESHLPTPSYTLRTIEHLQEKNPLDTYFLCIGEDSLASFQSWWHYRDILSKVPLIVAKRPCVNSSDISRDILEQAIFVDHEQVDVSSTEIRKKAQNSDETLNTLVPKAVAMYIMQQNLYSD